MRIALWTAPIMKFVSHWVVAAAEWESSALADFPREQLGPQAQYEDPLDNTTCEVRLPYVPEYGRISIYTEYVYVQLLLYSYSCTVGSYS